MVLLERKAVSAIALTLLLISLLTLAFEIQPVKAGTIVVPDDSPTIQEAVNNANDGDMIFVRNGTYYENIVLNKSVALVGEDPDGTIIDGSGNGTVVSLEAEGVAVSDFTIRDSGGGSDYDSGIFVKSSWNNLTNNIVASNHNGILINPDSDDDTLINNTVNANDLYGIHLWYSNNSVLNRNIVTNGYDGIIIEECSNITMNDNTMSGNVFNFGLGGVALTDFVHNIDISNKIEGKPIQYLLNKNGTVVDSKWEVGYLCVVNSTNVTVKDLALNTPSWNGVLFAYTTDSTIENVTSSQTSYAIDLTHSSYNTLANNDISNRNGIRLWYSDENTISNNSISQNAFAVSLFYSSHNTIIGNEIYNNWRGIFLYSSNNKIYHNSFIDNGAQVYTDENVYANTWDNGYPSGGNYWSDYNGTDIRSGQYQNETGSDGIGDTPYTVDGSNTDHYPLMHLFVPLSEDLNQDGKVDLLDAILAAKAFGSTPSDKNWNSTADLNGDGQVDILDMIMLAQNFGKIYHP
jgi:parallel beta-helix repeat protein